MTFFSFPGQLNSILDKFSVYTGKRPTASCVLPEMEQTCLIERFSIAPVVEQIPK